MDSQVFPKCHKCNPNLWIVWIANEHNDRFNREMETPLYLYEQEQMKKLNGN